MSELEDILNYLETTSLEPHDDYVSEFSYKKQKILWSYIKELQRENQELKKQLDELQTLYNNMFKCHCNRVQVETLLEQQKEFIEWLESEIERIPTLTTFFYNREGHYISETEVMLKEAKKVYKKYKEIIGVKDETPGNNRCRFN